ncbi:MAG: glycosyltransferase [Bacteroidetes bacterium]|nr:glycosyltransferase [Bacteroidota bacterium]
MAEHHELYLIAFTEHPSEMTYQTDLESIFKEVHLVHQPVWRSWVNSALNFFYSTPFQIAYFRSRKMQQVVQNFVESHDIDVIHTQHLRMAQYTVNVRSCPRILDLPDAYSLYWERRKTVKRPLVNRLFDAIESSRVVNYERIVTEFDLGLVCSVEDRDHMRNLHKKADIELLRNGVDLETFQFTEHDYSRNQTLLFTGNMDYAPNVDAVTYFVQHLFDPIRAKYPTVKLIIAGQRPVKEVRDLASEAVVITGFVEDISEMYAQADVVIAPLRFGAGTQNKVLEAMAMGVPVVCTQIGFAGLEIESGEGVLYAPNDQQFVQSVLELLGSETKRREVGQKGLELARNRFSWDGITRQLEHYFEQVAENG